MRLVTHELSENLDRFADVPSFRFENTRMSKVLSTSGRMTIAGQVINRVYVESLEFPRTLDNTHHCLFIVSIPYFSVFCRMYQERFGSSDTTFDSLSKEHIIQWVRDTYNVKQRKAKQLLSFFDWSLLKLLHNPDAVNSYLTENPKGVLYKSYTYDTIYRFLRGDLHITVHDYVQALANYRRSNRAIVKWLIQRLDKEQQTIDVVKLKLWLSQRRDSDLLFFAREEI